MLRPSRRSLLRGGSAIAATKLFAPSIIKPASAAFVLGKADGGGGGGYVAPAVHFDGNTSLFISSLSCTDGGSFSIVSWSKLHSLASPLNPDADQTIFASGADGTGGDQNYFQTVHDRGSWDCSFNSADFSGGNTFRMAENCNPVDTWNCTITTVKLDIDEPDKIFKCYVNGVDQSTATGDNSPAYSPAMNGLNFVIGDDLCLQPLVGDLCDVRIMPNISLLTGGDISPETLALFIDENGKPVDPAVATVALGTSAILFSGDATSFATNQGTGGSFIIRKRLFSEVIGASGPGAVSLPGAVIGQTVSAVYLGSNQGLHSSDFESVITVNDQIQQTSSDDYSGFRLNVYFPSGALTNATTSPSD